MIHDQDCALGINYILELHIREFASFQGDALMVPTLGEVIKQHARNSLQQHFLRFGQLDRLIDTIVFSHAFSNEETRMLSSTGS